MSSPERFIVCSVFTFYAPSHTPSTFASIDYGNYGPLFIRLAWHCSGTFRKIDGRGSCSGGRIRFEPERSWADNTNLDKARRLLWPIKEKYGLGLSWGDLFVSAGTVSIEAMGGPTLGLCFGRVDDEDGARSVGLDDCADGENGDCKDPMGATTMELIYVNPEGPMGQPIPDQSAPQVRETFERMGMNDRETVALIGGGHAFGKTHGACDEEGAAGDSPRLAEEAGLDPDVQAWQGKCGSGVGAETSTSGFEGPWTPNPISWDNTYFTILNGHTWENKTGPGGKQQWHSTDDPDLSGLGAEAGTSEPIMMLTSDVSLLNDPENKYQAIVKEFAEDSSSLDKEFAAAWHKLTTSGWGKGKPRCTGAMPRGFEEEDAGQAEADAADNAPLSSTPSDESVDSTDSTATSSAGLRSSIIWIAIGSALGYLVVV